MCYMRLTQTEIDQSATVDDNPYKTINRDHNIDVSFESVGKKQFGIIEKTRELDADGKETITKTPLGIGAALSALGTLRGADFSDISELYFDEYIPVESVVKTPVIKQAGKLFKNAYETMNRNRELFGKPPIRCYFTANAFSLDSDILYTFRLVNVLQYMQEKGQRRYTDKERSIYVELCEAPEVSAAKMQTALYKALGAEDDFVKMAISNEFSDYVLTLLKKVPIIEYRPIAAYKNVTIYMHKSDGTLYAAKRKDSVPDGCAYDESSRGVFINKFYFEYKTALQMREIAFDSVETKQILDNALDKSIKL